MVWKPSEQANMLISFGLPPPDFAHVVLRGRIRSYTKGDLRSTQALDRTAAGFTHNDAWSASRLRMCFLCIYMYNLRTRVWYILYLRICYTMAASGLPVIHEWSVLIGHEGGARVV